MAGNEDSNGRYLTPPVVTGLRQEAAGGRMPMERTSSMNIREEREDLKEAAEQSPNVILDLGLDGIIRWVSPSWNDVIGTSAASVKGLPIADILLSNKDGFTNAVESMKKDDSRSQIIRFQVLMGPDSMLKQRGMIVDHEKDERINLDEPIMEEEVEHEEVLNLEGQGIMVYDWSSGGESHVSVQIQLASLGFYLIML